MAAQSIMPAQSRARNVDLWHIEHKCLPNLEQDTLINGSTKHKCLSSSEQDLLIDDNPEHKCLPSSEQDLLIDSSSEQVPTQFRAEFIDYGNSEHECLPNS